MDDSQRAAFRAALAVRLAELEARRANLAAPDPARVALELASRASSIPAHFRRDVLYVCTTGETFMTTMDTRELVPAAGRRASQPVAATAAAATNEQPVAATAAAAANEQPVAATAAAAAAAAANEQLAMHPVKVEPEAPTETGAEADTVTTVIAQTPRAKKSFEDFLETAPTEQKSTNYLIKRNVYSSLQMLENIIEETGLTARKLWVMFHMGLIKKRRGPAPSKPDSVTTRFFTDCNIARSGWAFLEKNYKKELDDNFIDDDW